MRLEALQCGYGRREVGPPVTADLACGAIHAILGANGAGKSTLVRTVAGLQPAMSGRLRIGEHDVPGLSPRERARRVAFVASTPPAASGLTAGEVLGLMPGTERDHRAALEQLGDLGWWEARLFELSDGQRQRVMLARAFLQDTPWMVLDEPTAFLDAQSRSVLFGLLDGLAIAGRGVVLTTHDLHLLQNMRALGGVYAVGDSWKPLPVEGTVAVWAKG